VPSVAAACVLPVRPPDHVVPIAQGDKNICMAHGLQRTPIPTCTAQASPAYQTASAESAASAAPSPRTRRRSPAHALASSMWLVTDLLGRRRTTPTRGGGAEEGGHSQGAPAQVVVCRRCRGHHRSGVANDVFNSMGTPGLVTCLTALGQQCGVVLLHHWAL
jgi:hypothetical protein